MNGVSPDFQLPADLRRRVGQLVLAGFRGLTPIEAEPALRQIRSGVLGNALLYDLDAAGTGRPRNIESPAQTAALVSALAGAAVEFPVLTALDEEGGWFHRLKEQYGFFNMPAPQELASGGSTVPTAAAAATAATTMRELGIRLNLAPVVDLDRPGNRSVGGLGRCFGSSPDTVLEHARVFIQAHRDRGVLTTLKHFPGSGSAVFDKTTGLEVATNWDESELDPFRELIRAGMADAVLVARQIVPALDPETPPTLSKRIVDGMLRQDLGFDGVAISDAIEMAAIWGRYGSERAMVMALNAGIDVLLFCNIEGSGMLEYDAYRAEKAVDSIVEAVERGDIDEARIDEACTRVLRLKSRLAA